jgi:hypothetical protein
VIWLQDGVDVLQTALELGVTLEDPALGRLEDLVEAPEDREGQDDLAVVRALIVAPKEVGHRPDEVVLLSVLVHPLSRGSLRLITIRRAVGGRMSEGRSTLWWSPPRETSRCRVGVHVWGEVQNRLIEVRASSRAAGTGLRIEGLPAGRRRTADRVRAALINAGVVFEAPDAVIRLKPVIRAGPTGDLDVALAVAALASAGVIGGGLRWILATGRLRLDGAVHETEVTLGDVVARLCQTPLLVSERMFESERP